MNNARVDVTTEAGTSTVKEEVLNPSAHWTAGPHPHAVISITTGRSAAYGEIKATATVTLMCDQTSAAMDETAFIAFRKAVEYMNDAFGLLVDNLDNPG